jgi:hypothetical protein
MRLVSESGLLSFQLFFGPFHLVKNFGLLRFSYFFNLQSLATAIPLFGSLFIDLKTFMASAMSTCRALAEKVKIEKGNFPVPGRAEAYLASIFGPDFMQLPPEEKRETHSRHMRVDEPCRKERDG